MLSCLKSLVVAVTVALGTAALPTGPVAAEEAPDPAQQIELSPQMIEGFLGSYPEIRALGLEFQERYGHVDADPEDPASLAMAYARYGEARAEMEAILARHEIESMEAWARIAYSLMIAYSFAEGGEDIGSIDSEMAETIEQIRADSDIPDSQKEQLIAMLESQLAELGRLRPPDGNIELAGRYLDEIRTVIDEY